MAQAVLKSTTTTDDQHEADLVLALSLSASAESAAREATGWAQIIETRLNGDHIGLAGRDVLCRCITELERSAAAIASAAVALLDLIGATDGEIHG
jgi:hypothetical protein